MCNVRYVVEMSKVSWCVCVDRDGWWGLWEEEDGVPGRDDHPGETVHWPEGAVGSPHVVSFTEYFTLLLVTLHVSCVVRPSTFGLTVMACPCTREWHQSGFIYLFFFYSCPISLPQKYSLFLPISWHSEKNPIPQEWLPPYPVLCLRKTKEGVVSSVMVLI